jgi:predicted DNA-binding protein (MmcQ/YjbR family)
MNIEEIREYCLSKKASSECLPFDESTLVFKVLDKMFALINLDGELRINLKCDPEKAVELREYYSCVIPGFHMNKKYWNSVLLDSSVPDNLLIEWIDHSYDEVVKKMSRKFREQLGRE